MVSKVAFGGAGGVGGFGGVVEPASAPDVGVGAGAPGLDEPPASVVAPFAVSPGELHASAASASPGATSRTACDASERRGRIMRRRFATVVPPSAPPAARRTAAWDHGENRETDVVSIGSSAACDAARPVRECVTTRALPSS